MLLRKLAPPSLAHLAGTAPVEHTTMQNKTSASHATSQQHRAVFTNSVGSSKRCKSQRDYELQRHSTSCMLSTQQNT
jgi:hypothetical protein